MVIIKRDKHEETLVAAMFYLPKSLHQQLKTFAAAEGATMSTLVASALQMWLTSQQKKRQ